MKNNFSRSNVNPSMLQITQPDRSTFQLGHKNDLTIPFGKVIPVNHCFLLPGDTFQGSLSPQFQLEKVATPQIGPIRLDTHHFLINLRRINKDLRTNIEDRKPLFPSFPFFNNISYLFNLILSFSDYTGDDYKMFNFVTSDISPRLKTQSSLTASYKPGYNIIKYLEALVRAFDNLSRYCTDPRDSIYEYSSLYYQFDKYSYLHSYYSDVLDRWKSEFDKTKLPNGFTGIQWFSVLHDILRPFIGESSLADYLGYPTFTSYHSLRSIANELVKFLDDSLHTGTVRFDPTESLAFTMQLSGLADFARIYFKAPSPRFYSMSDPIVSDLPLRAYYTAWYDYLRNWHIESSGRTLNPDRFNNDPIFTYETQDINNLSQAIRSLNLMLLVFMPQERNFNSDFLTSVQTDDAFRHVFSPVFPSDEKNNVAFISHQDQVKQSPSTIQGQVDSLTGMMQAVYGDSASVDLSNSTPQAMMYQDLVTMRRSNMLERWLARNYYFPDTYTGWLQARFGIKPSDYDLIVSKYIGGAESFLSGDQHIANTGTEQTPAGTRTFVGNMSDSDSFSGSVSDYSYLISFVSTVPILTYDITHPCTRLNNFMDIPSPEYATDTRVEAKVSDFIRNYPSDDHYFGYVPRYYFFRVAGDETHGRYLSDYRSFKFLRDFFELRSLGSEFSLTPYHLRVKPFLDAFLGLKEWDDFAYGSCDVNLSINRALPAAVEVI